jgi:hypothetical protein
MWYLLGVLWSIARRKTERMKSYISSFHNRIKTLVKAKFADLATIDFRVAVVKQPNGTEHATILDSRGSPIVTFTIFPKALLD